MTYNKLYKFLKNSIIILALMIGIKAHSADYDPARSCQLYNTSIEKGAIMVNSPAGLDACNLERTKVVLPSEVLTECYHEDGTGYWIFLKTIPVYVANAYKTCPDDALMSLTLIDNSDCSCGCPVDTIFYEPTQTCVAECTGENMDYTANGGCACSEGFTMLNGECIYGDDPEGDEDGDGIPNNQDPDYDNDGDGVSNGVDEDWLDDNPDYDPNVSEDTYAGYCEALAYLVADSPAGYWYKSGNLVSCGVIEQNVAKDGETTYISRIDAYTCSPIDVCVVKLSNCALDEYYNEALGSCTLPRENVICTETLDYLIANNNGICQKNFLCEDGSTVYASESVVCPVEGSAEDNASISISTQQAMVDAMKQYGSATETGQQDIIDNIKSTNDSLETINNTLSGVDTLLNHQNDKIDITNNSLEKLNTLVTDGISNNYAQLGDIKSAINQADGNNINGLADISGKLQELIDKNETSSTDLSSYFEGDNPFDGNYTDGSENFTAYSAELNTSFSSFIITDPLGLNAMGSAYTVPEIGFDIQGNHYNLFGASFMSYVPIDLIRNLFMFMAVMSGLFVFFRTV